MKIFDRIWAPPNTNPPKINPSIKAFEKYKPQHLFSEFYITHIWQWLLNVGRTFYSSSHCANSALWMDIRSLYHWAAPPSVLLCRCFLRTCYPILKSVGGMLCCWIFSSAMVWGFTLACTSATSWKCVTIIGKASSKFHVMNEVVMTQKELYKLSSNPSAENNSWSLNIVQPNFENVRPIKFSQYDWTWSLVRFTITSSVIFFEVLSFNKLCTVKFVRCPTKTKIWKDIMSCRWKSFPALNCQFEKIFSR